MKLIDDIDLYEKRVELIRNTGDFRNRKSTTEIGTHAIHLFLVDVPDPVFHEKLINQFEFYRSFFIYIKNISFIIHKIITLAEHHKEYYESLHTKLFLNIPNLYPTLVQLEKYENEITSNKTYVHGLTLYEQIVITRKQIDLILPTPEESIIEEEKVNDKLKDEYDEE